MKYIIFCFIIFSETVKADFWDSFFPPTPYNTEKEVISDLKLVLKYVDQCAYVTCSYDTGWPFKEVRSCTKYGKSFSKFRRRYKLTKNIYKTKHVEWYLKKINYIDTYLCD